MDYYSFKSYFQLFFIELINLLSANININTTEMLNTDIQSKQSIFIDNYFFYNHQYNMTLCDLANKLNYSVAQTNRILNNLYGLSFKQKLIETRMKKSKYYLQYTNYSIDDIAFIVGYKSRNSFEAVFINYFGITPAAFKSSLSCKISLPPA